MSTDYDLVFRGRHEVIVVDGRKWLQMHPATDPAEITYLAGSYTDGDDPSVLQASRIGKLDGQFALIRFNTNERKLTVSMDRYGLYPLYWTRRGDRYYISSDIRAFHRLGLPLERDAAALSDLVAFNVPFGRRTPWRDVSTFGG